MNTSWRLVAKDTSFNCWILMHLTDNMYTVLNDLNAEVYKSVEVIHFKSREDLLVFRLRCNI